MHEHRPAAPPALSLAMPSPPLPRRRSSRLSSASDPHTPPPRNSTLPILSPSSNRKSSDSWNSSNYDAADDFEWEWKPEQTRLLSRTLDALPAHLLTPYNGPVPPGNLLDKIARGILNAKGPGEWPHTLRATRAKIIELARLRAKEDTASDTIAEEENTDPDVLQQTTNKTFKRPLHRQSSMDFMQSTKLDSNHETIARLSYRLQHTERMIPNPAFPYMRGSPRSRTRTLASTASSTTLNSQSSCSSGSRIPRLRRSLSSISNSSDSYIQQPAVDARVHRIKRAESFAGSALYPPGSPLKRAPSFGVVSKRSSDAMSVDHSNRSDVTTSDEEEKVRGKKAKKPRVKAASPTPPVSPPSTAAKSKPLRRTTKHITTASPHPPNKDTPRRSTKPKMNLQRNPSMFGPELPSVVSSPREVRRVTPSRIKSITPCSPSHGCSLAARSPDSHSTRAARGLVFNDQPCPHNSAGRSVKTLPRRAPAGVGRKISFGSLATPPEEENAGPGASSTLGSAFQLQ